MSWELAAYGLLALALAAGFAWYERSHPSARTLALVGTLAALAALGRIAFAPLPNVKPTTDIVLLSGYVLGGAPGFAVGAIAALASNFFFGQGPWTPWQMVGWGLVGILGAAFAGRAGRRSDPGRLRLALACAVAGVLYAVVLNVSIWVTFTGDGTLAKLGTVFATSFWFDVAHVAGNVAFALAFGPALVRALRRYRDRFEVRWLPVPAAGSVAAVLAVVVAAGALGSSTVAQAAPTSASVAYLERAQNEDGGWGGAPGQRSTHLHTGWTALGLAAAGRNPLDVSRGGRTPIDFTADGIGRIRDVGDVERTILVVAAAGLDPRAFAGRDLVADLLADQRRDGSFAGRVNHTAFGILALRAAGRSTSNPPVRRATRWLARQPNGDGGFNFFRRGGPSGVDDTAAAVEGLVAGGRRRTEVVERAVRYLVRQQRTDGGFPLQRGGASNAQSTAFVVQALVAVRRDPDRVRRRGGRGPIGYLRRLTDPDGSVRYSRGSRQTPVWVTGEALLAFARKPFPLRAVPRATRARAERNAVRGRATERPAHRAAQRRRATTRRRAAATAATTELLPYARAAGAFLALVL